MTILCYHAVEDDWVSPLAVPPAEFREQCAWLAKHRTVVPLSEALRVLDSRGRLPRGVVALTFDDGFASVLEHALPALQEHGLPAAVFPVAQTLTPQGQPVDWVDTPPPHRSLTTLTLDQLLALRDAGMEVGSHTWAHLDLRTLDEDACTEDLRRSRELLEDLLGQPVPVLAYPRGLHDEKVRRCAQAAGYEHALALPEDREVPGAYAVPRVGIHQGNGLRAMRLKTQRWYLPLRTSRAYLALRGHRPADPCRAPVATA